MPSTSKVEGFFYLNFFKIYQLILPADMTNRAQEHFNISQSFDKQPKVKAISCQALDNFNYHSAANYLHFIHILELS